MHDNLSNSLNSEIARRPLLIRKFTTQLALALSLICCIAGCGDDEVDGVGNANSKGKKAGGFDSPTEALDALGQAMVDGDDKAYRQIAAQDEDAIKGLEAFIGYEKDSPRDVVAKRTLKALAPNQGFGDVPSRRFPAEVKGDSASIIQLFERKLHPEKIHFRKFLFSKKNGQWFLVGSEFGKGSDLGAKFAWENAKPVKSAKAVAVAPISSIKTSVAAYVPEDAIAAVVFHPRHAAASEIGKIVTGLPAAQAVIEESKIKPADVERVIYAVGIPTEDSENDCVIVHLGKSVADSKTFSRKTILEEEFGEQYDTVKFNDVTYYREHIEPKATQPEEPEKDKKLVAQEDTKPDANRAEVGKVLARYPGDRQPNANGHADSSDSGNWFYYSSHTVNPTEVGANTKELRWYKPFKRYQSPRGKMGNTSPHIGYTLYPSPMATPPRFPVLHWSSRSTATVRVKGNFQKFSKGGNGVQAIVYFDGEQRFSQHLGGNDKVGIDFSFVVDIEPGSEIDFVVDPKGSGTGDSTHLSLTIEAVGQPVAPKPRPATKPRAVEKQEPKKQPVDEPIDPLATVVYFPDSKTVVRTSEEQLRQLIKGKTADKAKTPLAIQLKRLKLTEDIATVFAHEGHEAGVANAIRMLMPADVGDEDIDELSGLASVLKSASVSISLNGPTLLKLEIEAKTKAAANEINGGLEHLVGMLKGLQKGLPKQIQLAGDEVDNPVLPIVQQLIDGTVVQQPGNRVVVEMQFPKALITLAKNDAKKIAPLIAALSGGESELEPKADEPDVAAKPPEIAKKNDGPGQPAPKEQIVHRPPPANFPNLRDLAIQSHDCRVFFPGNPKFTEDIAKIAAGNVHVASFEGRTAAATYVLEIYTYPKAFVDKMGPDLLLDRTRDTLVDKPNGQQISSKPITYQGSKGMDFVYRNQKTTLDGTGHCRVVIKGNRVWLLELDGRNVPAAEIAAFHNSLVPYELPAAEIAKIQGVKKPEPTVSASNKKSVPNPDQQEQALTLIRDVFKVDAVKTDEQREALVAALMKAAKETADVNQRYMMLEFARETAASVSNIDLTLEAVVLLESSYQVDPIALRTKAFSQLGKARVATDQRMVFVDHLLEVAEQAIKADQFESSITLLTLAQSNARSARELMIGRQIGLRQKEAEKLATEFTALQASLKTLVDNPRDPDACLKVGRFRCFGQGRWDEGLELVAKGADASLAKIAKLDLDNPTTTANRIAVGDQWWQLAISLDGAAQREVRSRAGHWYQRARPAAKGLVAQKIDSRLEELKPPKARARVVDLMKLIDLRKHSVKGAWRGFRGTLVSTEESGSRVVIPYNPPEEYDLTLNVERKTRDNHFAVGVTANGVLNLILLDFRNSRNSSLFSVPQITNSLPVFTNNRPTKIVVSVRKQTLTVTANGREVIKWTGQTRLEESRSPDWKVPAGTKFFIGSSSSVFQIHEIELTPR